MLSLFESHLGKLLLYLQGLALSVNDGLSFKHSSLLNFVIKSFWNTELKPSYEDDQGPILKNFKIT